MVIHPATEADLQAVVELVAQGRAALALSGRRPVAGRQSLAGDDPARPAARRRTHRAHRRCGGRLRPPSSLTANPAYDRIEEGGWAAEGPYVAVHRLVVGERFVRRGVAPRCCGEAAREALVRGIRSFRHRHASRQRAHACAAREGGVRLSGQGALRSRAAGLREADPRLTDRRFPRLGGVFACGRSCGGTGLFGNVQCALRE